MVPKLGLIFWDGSNAHGHQVHSLIEWCSYFSKFAYFWAMWYSIEVKRTSFTNKIMHVIPSGGLLWPIDFEGRKITLFNLCRNNRCHLFCGLTDVFRQASSEWQHHLTSKFINSCEGNHLHFLLELLRINSFWQGSPVNHGPCSTWVNQYT